MKYPVRIFVLLVVLVCTAGFAFGQDTLPLMDYATPKEYKIGSIEIEGTQYLDKTVLKTLSGLRQGDDIKIPGEDIQKAIKALWRQKLFTDVRIEVDKIVDNEVFLIIRVQELPRIGSKPKAPKSLKNSEWEDILKKIDVSPGMV